MKRRTSFSSTTLFFLIVAPGMAWAQEDDITFTPEEASGTAPDPASESTGDTGGDDDMTFDVVDTEKEAAASAVAAKEEHGLIRVIQRRPFLQANRVEVAPFMATNVNDPLVKQFMAGGTLNYYISEYMAIGVHGGYSLGTETDLFDEVIEDYELFPQVSKVKWLGELQFQYDPIYGKFTLFDAWIVPWDIYTTLAAGYTQTELDGHVTLAAGIGQRFYMNRWFTVNVDLRDHLYTEEYPAGSEFVHNLVVGAGVGFFLPPDFEYKTLK